MFLDISTEYMKYANKFWSDLYSENCQLSESFYRFQFTLMYHEKSVFVHVIHDVVLICV